MAQHKKNKKLGWGICGGWWDGWVLAASDLMIRTKITTRTMWRTKREKKFSN